MRYLVSLTIYSVFISLLSVSAQDKPKRTFAEGVLFGGGNFKPTGAVLGAGLGTGWNERFVVMGELLLSRFGHHAIGLGAEEPFRQPISNSRFFATSGTLHADLIR